jgi:hypothetical protein
MHCVTLVSLFNNILQPYIRLLFDYRVINVYACLSVEMTGSVITSFVMRQKNEDKDSDMVFLQNSSRCRTMEKAKEHFIYIYIYNMYILCMHISQRENMDPSSGKNNRFFFFYADVEEEYLFFLYKHLGCRLDKNFLFSPLLQTCAYSVLLGSSHTVR